MSLELPDFVGSARHTEASAFDFLCKEEKQNKTKVSVYHGTRHRKTCTIAPKLPRFLESCLKPGREFLKSNKGLLSSWRESSFANRHSRGSGWLRGSVNLQASQGRKAEGSLESRAILLGSLDDGSYELRLLWIMHMFENAVRSANV